MEAEERQARCAGKEGMRTECEHMAWEAPCV